jgi:hypothetical protein
MPTPIWTRLVIGLAAGLAILIVWLTTGDVDFEYAKWLVTASGAVILGLLAFDRLLWRYPPLSWLTRRLVLHGTWKMEGRTDFAARADETIEHYLVIRQTYSRIRVDGLFDRSNSHSMSADLAVEDGRCTLSYIFRSEAQTRHREGNPPSRGAAVLRVARQPQLHLVGDYWMERKTGGDVKSVGYSRKVYDTFGKARAAEYTPH